MNVNVGGCKGFKKYPQEIRDSWRTLDVHPNADIVHDLNSGCPIPLCDSVVGCYYASHVLEHVRMERQQYVFSELYRTLGYGGQIRIVVPDFALAIGWYARRDNRLLHEGPAIHESAPHTMLGALLSWVYTPDRRQTSGHCMAFDIDTLRCLLREAKFESIIEYSCGQGSSAFDGLDFPKYDGWCLFVEATK